MLVPFRIFARRGMGINLSCDGKVARLQPDTDYGPAAAGLERVDGDHFLDVRPGHILRGTTGGLALTHAALTS